MGRGKVGMRCSTEEIVLGNIPLMVRNVFNSAEALDASLMLLILGDSDILHHCPSSQSQEHEVSLDRLFPKV